MLVISLLSNIFIDCDKRKTSGVLFKKKKKCFQIPALFCFSFFFHFFLIYNVYVCNNTLKYIIVIILIRPTFIYFYHLLYIL